MNTGMRSNATAWLSALCLASCASAPGPGNGASGGAGAGTASGLGATAPGGVTGLLGSVADKALEAIGWKPPVEVPDSALPDRRIRWQLHASSSLNATEAGQPLALVVRVFRLRSPDGFLQAQREVFGDATREKQALGDDLVGAREVQLVPGQHHEATDKVARDVPYLGIVALYRQPATGRWRYAFKAAEAELSGISLGAHACALSVQSGEPVNQSVASVRSAAVPCP